MAVTPPGLVTTLSFFFIYKYTYNTQSLVLLHDFISYLDQYLPGVQVSVFLNPNLCDLSNFF